MNQQTTPNVTLFDLLARNWRRPSAIKHICFNNDDTLLAMSCFDGTVALARLADNEPPESRITIDNGRTTIHPREGRPSPLINTRIRDGGGLTAFDDGETLVLTAKGDLLRINRSGEISAKVLADKSPIIAFDYCRSTGLMAAVLPNRLRLQWKRTDSIREAALSDPISEVVSISNDGCMIALAAATSLNIRHAEDDLRSFREIALSARPISLIWSADNRWLACGLETGGFCLVDIASGGDAILSDFPGPIRTLDWSQSANAVFASGAYRIAGWSMDTPPLSNSSTGALATGHPGFVMVDAVASHPFKKLVAAGYANGKIVIAKIGSPDELVIRDTGGPVTALQWSADGKQLGMGDALGNAAIITFPNQFFK
ncbi:WD40 repeat domain-containing protein [Rhizobium sp. LEGMi198b]